MNRRRLGVALATLIPLTVPVPARAVSGSFMYWSNTNGAASPGQRHRLNAPPTDSCQVLNDDQSGGTYVYKVENDTDTPATVYGTVDCTGHRLMVPTKASRTAGGHGPASFNSVKFRP